MTVSTTVSQEALPHAVGLTYLTFMSTMPPEIVLGAFTGSIIFLLGVSNKPKWQWMLYFTVAFMAGLLGAAPVSEIASGILHLVAIPVVIPKGMGALVSASCVINVITWLRDHPTFFLRRKDAEKGDAA